MSERNNRIGQLTAFAVPFFRFPSADDPSCETRYWVVRWRSEMHDLNFDAISETLTVEAQSAVQKALAMRELPLESVKVAKIRVFEIDALHVVVAVETTRMEDDVAYAYLVAASAALHRLEQWEMIDDLQGIPRNYWYQLLGPEITPPK